MPSLLLDGDAKCYECALLLVRQCTELMASHFYSYAEPRGEKLEKLNFTAMPAAIKEAAVRKVQTGEQATLENALRDMGYNRQQAWVIHKD